MEKGQVSITVLIGIVVICAVISFSIGYLAMPVKVVEKPVGEGVEKPTREKLVIFTYYSGPASKKAIKAITEDFKKAYPNIDVRLELKPHEEFKVKFRSWLPLKRPPADVYTWFTGERLKFFVDKGLVLPLDDVWDKIGKYYLPSAEEMIKFHGHDYGVTIFTDVWALTYRKSIFEDLGLSPPETWDELLSTYETLEKNGITPVCIGTKYRWTIAGWFDAINLAQNGLDFHMKLMRGEIPYTDDRVRETMKKLGEVVPYFLEGHSAMSWSDALTHMVKKECATYLMGTWLYEEVPEEVRGDFKTIPFPTINPDIPLYVDAPTGGMIIAKNAVNKETAKKYLEFITMPEEVNKLEKISKTVTYLKPEYVEYKGYVKYYVPILEKAEGAAQFYDRDTTPPMADEGLDAMVRFCLHPEELDSVLEEMESARKEIFG